ncbi:protein Wnt-5 [Anopheles moucheti]|uniref:protein Wnt-5 n=1 Tax=Anopheles moucheti TaxID=186751 RepID=UPI0022F0AE73|nr:protein Wnt-5 [Anopheles moucheti]
MCKTGKSSTKKATMMAAGIDSSHSWIIFLWIATFILGTASSTSVLGVALGQGIPTWISLGIKSPFIVFRTEQEVLSNNSVLLNLTDIRNKLKSVHNLDHFIRPIDGNADNKNTKKDTFAPKGAGGRIGTVGSTNSPPAAPPVFSAESAFSSGNVSITFLTTVAPSFVNHFEKSNGNDGEHGARPILSMRNKPHIPSVLGSGDHMISDDDGGGGNGKKERKYIIPLALKTSTNEKEKTSSVFHGSSTNIDDLKRHILMLQNLTQSDKNFQSKFVVFPSLQKNGTERTGQTTATTTPATVSPHHLSMAAAGSSPKDVKEYRNFAPSLRGQSTKGDTNATNNRSLVRPQISSSINVPKKAFPDSHDIMSDKKEEALQAFKAEKITIVPQVFLQNDQTSEAVTDKENNLNESANRAAAADSAKMTAISQVENGPPFSRMRETREKNVVRKFGHKSTTSGSSKSGPNPEGGILGNARNNQTVLTTPHVKTSSSTNIGKGFPNRAASVEIEAQRWNMNGPKLNGTSSAKPTAAKRDGKKKQRKNGKRRGGKQTIKLNGSKEQPKTVILNDDATVLQMYDIERTSSSDAHRQEMGGMRPTKPGRSTGSRKRSPSSSRVRRNENGGVLQQAASKQQQLYASTGRLHGQIGRDGRYESRMVAAAGSMESLAGTMDQLTSEGSGENSNNRSHNYRNRTLSADGNEKDILDLNPDLCYTLSALSGGQQKLCAQHTSIMPAISRGARAAIQECKHQFRNRRWNCSIVNDDTVFGPISNIGSPEMAFVYAMAAAAASSFIARACRDGQLASCGCSRSSRPSKLNEDWTWGGCGDDMEYGYKFTQTFIDIREKEKKRGTRGLVSIPAKYPKIIERLLDALNDTTKAGVMLNETDTILRPEDLEKLQDKIAKEIANSNLNPKEISDLQERINKEITNSEVFNLKNVNIYDKLKKIFRKPEKTLNGVQFSASAKARALMNLHNNEAGRRAVIKKSRIICKCHGVSGSCSLITCWQQLTSIREIGDFLREKYDEATQVKVNKRGRLQVKDPRYKIPSALDLIYLDESPDWCRVNRQLMWQGTHGRVCNKTSSGLDGCSILCCGRGYNTKKIIVKERCNCKFQWCCQVKCEVCTRSIEEYTCK